MFYNIKKYLHIQKTLRTFATELTVPTSIQVLIIAAFFISANQTSLGCCISSGSRYIALLMLANNSESNSLFYFKNIFNTTMPTSIKQCSTGNNSTKLNTSAGAKSVQTVPTPKQPRLFIFSPRLLDRFTKFLHSDKAPQPPVNPKGTYIFIEGAEGNPYESSLLKVCFKFLTEEVKGYCFTESRLMEGIKAARTLYPEERMSLLKDRNVKITML